MPAGLQINGIANDAAGAIYVVGQPVQNKTSEILVYAAGAMGSASPIRTIVGSATGLGYSICLTVDATGLLDVVRGYNIGLLSNGEWQYLADQSHLGKCDSAQQPIQDRSRCNRQYLCG